MDGRINLYNHISRPNLSQPFVICARQKVGHGGQGEGVEGLYTLSNVEIVAHHDCASFGQSLVVFISTKNLHGPKPSKFYVKEERPLPCHALCCERASSNALEILEIGHIHIL